MMQKLIGIASLLLLMLFIGCNDAEEKESIAENTATSLATENSASVDTQKGRDVIPVVKTLVVKKARLPLRRKTNGVLRARRQVILKMPSSGILLSAPQEGEWVKKGNLLFQLDDQEARLNLEAANAAYNEKNWRHQDMIRRMKDAAGTDSLTEIQTNNILIQSGLPTSEVLRDQAALNLQRHQLFAPFSGYLADCKVQANDQITVGEQLATLVDLNSLEAEFKLLEQELGSINSTTRCRVSWETNGVEQSVSARIDILNPVVEKGGLLRARAKLNKIPKGGKLYPGMNVSISLENEAPNGVIVPKSALVLRSERTVVFVYNPETKRTEWRYVEILAENDTSYALSEGIEPDEIVITSGALTLDHDILVDAQ